jgi:hypothetical protein
MEILDVRSMAALVMTICADFSCIHMWVAKYVSFQVLVCHCLQETFSKLAPKAFHDLLSYFIHLKNVCYL